MTETISQSSLIEKFSYDEIEQILHVHFRKGGHYGYSKVTPEKFEAFRLADSHGKFYLTEIKNNHQFSKYDTKTK